MTRARASAARCCIPHGQLGRQRGTGTAEPDGPQHADHVGPTSDGESHGRVDGAPGQQPRLLEYHRLPARPPIEHPAGWPAQTGEGGGRLVFPTPEGRITATCPAFRHRSTSWSTALRPAVTVIPLHRNSGD
ncbi:MAG: hypothetical protein ACRDST_05820 [Pseudonocardiaceae bacterium]